MHPVEIKTRDGLDHGLLPDPAAGQRPGRRRQAGQARADGAAGPWRAVGPRQLRLSTAMHQWLANRGYAVLSPNFRGLDRLRQEVHLRRRPAMGPARCTTTCSTPSTGRSSSGVTTADKVAIMGGSYGGYATLAGLAFTPDRFACGVDIVGPSNLATLLGTIPPYWEALQAAILQADGRPEHAGGQGAAQRSARRCYSADKIRRPLLIGQGANDPRVNVAESQQIVDAMQGQEHPRHLRRLPRRGPRLRPAGEQHRLQRGGGEFPGQMPGRPGRADRRRAEGRRRRRCPTAPNIAPGLSEALAAK